MYLGVFIHAHYIAAYYTMLHRVTLHVTPCYTVLHCMLHCYTMLHCVTPCYTVLHMLHCMLHCVTLYLIIGMDLGKRLSVVSAPLWTAMRHGTLTLMAERSRKECKYERSKVKKSTRSQGSYWNITEFGIEGEGRAVIEREDVLFPSVLLCEFFFFFVFFLFSFSCWAKDTQ